MQTLISNKWINSNSINKKINKKAVQASFSKAAAHYDQFADLQRDIGHHLIDLIPNSIKQANTILDLGCGTGYFSALFNETNESAQLTCFDLSPEMLKQTAERGMTRCQFVQGDIDVLPFTTRQFDLIFSNLVLQWSEQLVTCLEQAKKALNKQGQLCFSTLLNGSLIELQQAWKVVDRNSHINHFLTQESVQSALALSGFNNVRITTQTHVKKYADVIEVMKALKGIGANHVHDGQKNRTMGRQLLKQLEQGYQPFIDNDGLYNLSYQVCYVIADAKS
ncbi:malonyl-ACP O-methyltransferase BioC [Psychromonas sp. SP041]|uniref:malonyl-ACP O-methyltransferase BioC n=1 Tax=Psychromonas sp. SP041 TaxID=1365007 RepID=UPI0004147DF9|nr:malonyl-ACP O-methyltransferase BioC [Psychromonas sp. SP041]